MFLPDNYCNLSTIPNRQPLAQPCFQYCLFPFSVAFIPRLWSAFKLWDHTLGFAENLKRGMKWDRWNKG